MAEFTTAITKSGRRLDEVLDFHRFSPHILEGLVVADLGCGFSTLTQELADIDVDCAVIGFDGFMPSLQKARRDSAPELQASVKADIRALPVCDAAFDAVIATFSFPYWAKSEADIENFFKEADRVLKPGGLLSVYPMRVNSIYLHDRPRENQRHQERDEMVQGIAAAVALSADWQIASSKRGLLQAYKRHV